MKLLKPIKGFDSFNSVFKTGKKFYDNDTLGVFIFRNENIDEICFKKCDNPEAVYFGVTAGKKFIKKAVMRNRIKRLLRVSIRQVCQRRYSDISEIPFRFSVFSWRKSPEMQSLISLKDVYPSVENIIISAENYYKNWVYHTK